MAPEEVKAPAAEVTKGLNEIKVIAADYAAKAGTDKAAAKASSDMIEPVWRTIEGTIKGRSYGPTPTSRSRTTSPPWPMPPTAVMRPIRGPRRPPSTRP